MPKAILEFNLDDPFEQEAHRRAIKSTNAYLMIMAIRDEIFRPHRKHGYFDPAFQEYFNNDKTRETACCVTGRLEEMFYDLLDEYDINLNEDIS